MKISMSPRTVALMALGLIAPLSAQNLTRASYSSSAYSSADGKINSASTVPGTYEVPPVKRVKGEISKADSGLNTQDSLNLDKNHNTSRPVKSVVDFSLLRKLLPFRKNKVISQMAKYEVDTNSLQKGLEQISAAYRETGKSEKTPDCPEISLTVVQQVKLDSAKLLELVERGVSANPGCACEIVKSVIKASDAGTNEVVSLVEVAILAAPQSMRAISQCAIAASPESVNEVQALLTKLDNNAAETGHSAKKTKAKAASVVTQPLPNPLDRPYLPPLPLVTD